MNQDIQEILFTQEQIDARVAELANQIERDFQNTDDLVMIAVLKGGVVLATDLMRKLNLPITIDFIAVSSYYTGTESTGNVKIRKDTDTNIAGKKVLIVEDIVDSGVTLDHLIRLFKLREATEVKICTLLNKPARRRVPVKVDYYGFEIPDEFVVGYGLDYAQKYRNLPYIGVLKREVYE